MSGAARVSVVIEGYNESLALGSAAETVAALAAQDYPSGETEVLLVGSQEQVERWRATFPAPDGFADVTFLGADGAHYYELKNLGADAARGEVIAFLDADVVPRPGWLSALVSAIDAGADVVAGLSLFRAEQGHRYPRPFLTVASSVTWGYVLGEDGAGRPSPRGFLSHNVGFRAETFRLHRYRTDLGRSCAGTLLFDELRRAGAQIVLEPAQQVEHVFTLSWWLARLHVRFGHEVHLLRRLRPEHSWLRRTGAAEPLLTAAWHLALDVPQWLRFARALGVPVARRLALVPLVLATSAPARAAEAAGMYATLTAPARMRRFALAN